MFYTDSQRMCARTQQPNSLMSVFIIAILRAIKSVASEFLYFLLYLSLFVLNSSGKTLAAQQISVNPEKSKHYMFVSRNQKSEKVTIEGRHFKTWRGLDIWELYKNISTKNLRTDYIYGILTCVFTTHLHLKLRSIRETLPQYPHSPLRLGD